jgi:hypothetical protein
VGYRIVIPLITLIFTILEPVWASESGCTQVSPRNSKAPTEGLRVYVDPKTGELLSAPPPGEQLEPSAASSNTQDQGEILQVTRPDGSVVADTGDRFITELRVEIVDGKAVTCHQSAEDPQSFDAEAGSLAEEPLDDEHQ